MTVLDKTKLSRPALEMVAQKFRALSDPNRLMILQELCEGECSVGELCERVGTSQANVSKHLSTLAAQGIVSRRKEGLYAYYAIVDESIEPLCELVCSTLAERLGDAQAELMGR